MASTAAKVKAKVAAEGSFQTAMRRCTSKVAAKAAAQVKEAPAVVEIHEEPTARSCAATSATLISICSAIAQLRGAKAQGNLASQDRRWHHSLADHI